MKGFTVRRSRFAVRRWHPGAYLDCEAEIHRGAPLGSSVSVIPERSCTYDWTTWEL